MAHAQALGTHGAVMSILEDGRLHLQHGPIDCVIQAWGVAHEVRAAYHQVGEFFADLLPTLVRELTQLRTPLGETYPQIVCHTAQRMVSATWPYRSRLITPMAAVAGAVADTLLHALVQDRHIEKAYVNDGGDIALHLAPGAALDVGIAADPNNAWLNGQCRVHAHDTIRGVATSGWQGRSQSLGIADAVTVLADCAANADAAATMIANAVNVDHCAIHRLPAHQVKHDSDLGEQLVTVAVGTLPQHEIDLALDHGLLYANDLFERGLIQGACLHLQGYVRICGLTQHQAAVTPTLQHLQYHSTGLFDRGLSS